MKTILRENYIQKIRPYFNKGIIKVLTGQRRIGKSTILLQLQDEVHEREPASNLICINKELEEFRTIRTHNDLYGYVTAHLEQGKSNYLFIDEVQEIQDFQQCLRSLLAEDKCDIFCTGSNAQLLSGELATTLAGRSISFDIHGLGYQEFLSFHQLKPSQNSLMKYLKYGGMPYLAHIGLQDDIPFEYLRSIYSTILLKDTVARENIRNVHFLQELVAYLADNMGNLFSANNISKYLKSQHVAISPQVIINYLRALANAYLIYRVKRADIRGLKIFEQQEKIFFGDLGLANAITGVNTGGKIHKLMENAVYLHLLRAGYEVFVGELNKKEVDFVAVKNGECLYVQVSLSILEEKTATREVASLLAIQDNYPKFVVTLNDPIIGGNFKGIHHVNLADFLS